MVDAVKPYSFVVVNSETVHVNRELETEPTGIARANSRGTYCSTARGTYVVMTAWSGQKPVLPTTTNRQDHNAGAIADRHCWLAILHDRRRGSRET